MAKTLLKDASNEDLLAELTKRLGASEGAEESADAAFPDAETIDSLDMDALQELAEKIGLDHEDKDEDELKALLTMCYQIGADETDEITDPKAVKGLCAALGIKPPGKMKENIVAIKETLTGGGEEAEEGAEEEATEEEATEEAEEGTEEEASEEEEEEAPKKGKKGKKDADEEEEAEGEEEAEEGAEEETEEKAEEEEEASEEEASEEIDPAAVVKAKGKYPDEATMAKRLKSFNAVAGKAAIDAKKAGGTKKAYAKLLERLVDASGDIAKWGEPYIRDNDGWCCGLSMKETKFKGDKEVYGKCLITGKVYSADSEGTFVEKE